MNRYGPVYARQEVSSTRPADDGATQPHTAMPPVSLRNSRPVRAVALAPKGVTGTVNEARFSIRELALPTPRTWLGAPLVHAKLTLAMVSVLPQLAVSENLLDDRRSAVPML